MRNKKKIGIILIVSMSAWLIITIILAITAGYQWSKKYESYWSLAEKASTIKKKSENIDKFVQSLENSGMQGQYNSMFWPTPDNSFDQNFEALKTLQSRLKEIDSMDVNSFQYQTAIHQITEQEQGEGKEMICEFQGIWMKNHYILLWKGVGIIQILISVGILILGIIMCLHSSFD